MSRVGPNIKMQKTGAGVACQPEKPLPASDLERWANLMRA
jgi:hypothetical protein